MKENQCLYGNSQWVIIDRIAGGIGRHYRIMRDYERFTVIMLLEAKIVP